MAKSYIPFLDERTVWHRSLRQPELVLLIIAVSADGRQRTMLPLRWMYLVGQACLLPQPLQFFDTSFFLRVHWYRIKECKAISPVSLKLCQCSGLSEDRIHSSCLQSVWLICNVSAEHVCFVSLCKLMNQKLLFIAKIISTVGSTQNDVEFVVSISSRQVVTVLLKPF